MNKLQNKLGLLAIFVLATQQIRIPGMVFSIFQICVLLFLLASIVPAFSKSRSGSYAKVALVWMLSCLLAYITSNNPSWARSYLLLGIMASLLIFIIPNIYSREDIPKLEKWLIRSQYITIPFSVFCYYMYYSMGGLPDEISLPGGFSITLDDEMLSRGTAAGEVRLTLPYATPPILSIVMSMSVTLLLFSENLFNKYVKWGLVFVFSIIAIFTGSRSGIIGFVLLMVFLILTGEIKRYFRASNRWLQVVGLIAVVPLVLYASQSEYFSKMIINRFENPDSGGIMQDRHFLVPLDGIIIWLDSVQNFLFGIGFGSSANMMGAHTFLPPYFLNSYVTMVAERGILGLVINIWLISLVIKLFKLRTQFTRNECALVYTLFVGMFSGIFYENFICYFVIFTISISYLLYSYIKV